MSSWDLRYASLLARERLADSRSCPTHSVTESYHPRIVFPSVPSRIDVEVEPANPKAAAAATADDMAIDGDVDGGTPQPTQTQTPVQTQTQSLTSAQKLKIWIGSLKGDSASDEASGNEAEADNMGDNRERRTNQRLIEIGRFESHRLGQCEGDRPASLEAYKIDTRASPTPPAYYRRVPPAQTRLPVSCRWTCLRTRLVSARRVAQRSARSVLSPPSLHICAID